MNVNNERCLIQGPAILAFLVLVLLGFAHCAHAGILPDTVSAELMHTSHASQHFGPNPTNYGYEGASIVAKWALSKRFTLELSEGAVLGTCNPQWCEGLWGPREFFTARVSVTLWSRR